LCEARVPVCGHCADQRAESEGIECFSDGKSEGMAEREPTADRIREYADRRKMLGLMSPEVYREFEECIEELR
jgi:hypothetical protein